MFPPFSTHVPGQKSFPLKNLPGHAGPAAPAQRFQLRRGDPGALRRRRRPRGLAAAPRDAPGAAAHHGGHAAAVPQTGHLPGAVARLGSAGGSNLFWGMDDGMCFFLEILLEMNIYVNI